MRRHEEKQKMLADIKELPGFIRLNICISIASLAAIGYLLYSPPGQTLAYVILSAFFGCAGAYAYNNITDTREDLINRKRINHYSDKPAGKLIVALCTLAGLYFALRLSTYSLIAYLSFVTLLISYSWLRIKKYLLIKNIWTALGISQSLLIGALATAHIGITQVFAVVFLMALTGSIIADMRDVGGDRKTGVVTLPVELSLTHSAQLVYALSAAIAALILAIGKDKFYILLPFAPVAAVLVSKGRYSEAHATGRLSFIVLLLWLLSK